MSRFPDDVFDDLDATELELFGFGNTIPDRIKTLKRVESARIGDSNATAVPDALFALPKLRYLLLGLHRLKTIPNAISKAKALRDLDLCDTHALKELPRTIGSTKLETLRIIPGGLKTVPPELWKIRTLTWLELPPTVKKLPAGIGKLRKLEKLSLGGAAAFSIASELPELAKLRELDLELEEGVDVPAEVARLKLRELRLCGHQLTAVPSVVTQISTLERLDVLATGITQLSEIAAQLPNLSSINIWKKKFSAGERKRLARYLK